MENMMAEPISDGEPARSSAQVVSKVLSQDSSNSTFLKNAGLQPNNNNKSPTSSERALREELERERQSSAALQEQVDILNKKAEIAIEALEKTQRELAECKESQKETNVLLRGILNLPQVNTNQSQSQG